MSTPAEHIPKRDWAIPAKDMPKITRGTCERCGVTLRLRSFLHDADRLSYLNARTAGEPSFSVTRYCPICDVDESTFDVTIVYGGFGHDTKRELRIEHLDHTQMGGLDRPIVTVEHDRRRRLVHQMGVGDQTRHRESADRFDLAHHLESALGIRSRRPPEIEHQPAIRVAGRHHVGQ